MPISLPPVQVAQTAYVVADIERACRRLNEVYRVGPFFRIATYAMPDVVYRAQTLTEPVVIEAAFAQAGDVVIELIEQTSPGPSAFRDMFAPDEQGLHHVAMWTQDYAAEKQHFVDAGFEIAMEMPGRSGEYNICYVDTRPLLGHMIELYPDHPTLRGAYAAVRDRSRSWDGRELIQLL